MHPDKVHTRASDASPRCRITTSFHISSLCFSSILFLSYHFFLVLARNWHIQIMALVRCDGNRGRNGTDMYLSGYMASSFSQTLYYLTSFSLIITFEYFVVRLNNRYHYTALHTLLYCKWHRPVTFTMCSSYKTTALDIHHNIAQNISRFLSPREHSWISFNIVRSHWTIRYPQSPSVASSTFRAIFVHSWRTKTVKHCNSRGFLRVIGSWL